MDKITWNDWWREATNSYADTLEGPGPHSLLDMEVGKKFYGKGYTPREYVDYYIRKLKLREEGFNGMMIGDQIEHMGGTLMGELLDFFESNPCGYDCVCVKTTKGYEMAHHCKKMDLSKPFVKVLKEDEKTITYAVNLPNDQVGDQAFDYDMDGSERKKWDEYLERLDKEGIRGQLTYNQLTIIKNEAFDKASNFGKEYPLSSYKFLIVDYDRP